MHFNCPVPSLKHRLNTSRRAAYGYDQRFEVLGSKGMLQAGNHKPTEVTSSTVASVSGDKPEHFFLERSRAAYALEMAHFFEALAHPSLKQFWKQCVVTDSRR